MTPPACLQRDRAAPARRPGFGGARRPREKLGPRSRRLALPVAIAALVPALVSAQAGDLGDSAAALEAARAAQARFERVRRTQLPWTLSGSGSACGEVVGRFCWRPDDSDLELPSEPDGIGSARLGLLIELAGLSNRIPGDRWLLGQRVRYRIEGAQAAAGRARASGLEGDARAAAVRAADSAAAEHLAAAEALARSCRDPARDGWCDALLGLALHAAGRVRDAETAFAAARAGRPDDAGRDLRDVLDAGARRLLRETPDTAAFVDALWLLADPFWALPGNDRRAEHEARRVMARIQEDARNAFGVPWGDDLRELHVRFGWEVGWERTRRNSGAMASSATAVIGHQQDDGFGFLPAGELLVDPLSAERARWVPDGRPRLEGYAPPYLDSLYDAEHQLAAFRRGDSLVVLVALRRPGSDLVGDPSRDRSGDRAGAGARGVTGVSGFGLEPFDATAFVAWGGAPKSEPPGRVTAGEPVVVRADRASAAGPASVARMRALLPAGPYIVSVESLGRARVGARARYGFRRDALPEGVTDISDLLLYAPEDARAGNGPSDAAEPRASDLDHAVRRMLARAAVRPGGALGVAWEVYGVRPEGEAIDFDVALSRRGESFVRRAGRWLGLFGGGAAVSVRWTDAALPVAGVYGRTIVVETPADIPPGRYTLRVAARVAGRTDLVAEREVLVERGGR